MFIAFASLCVLAAFLSTGTSTATSRMTDDEEADVRWNIISLDTSTTPPTFNPGGVAFASAITGSAPSGRKIKFTGSGTFEAPGGGDAKSDLWAGDDVTGGGTWETFTGCPSACLSTGSGTYNVTELVSFEFAGSQTGVFIDNTGNTNERANGTAVLRIRYSDGSRGTLGVGCHGPGAPAGIEEGIIATKGFVTYWTGEVPAAGVDANRTLFHVRQEDDDDKVVN